MVTQYPDLISFDISVGGVGYTTDEKGDLIPNVPSVLSKEFKCRAEAPRAKYRVSNDGLLHEVDYVVYGKHIPRLTKGQQVKITFADGAEFTGTVQQMNVGQFNCTIWI